MYLKLIPYSTQLVQVKCSKYWPDLGIEKECGNMKIRLEKETYFASHAVRSMKLFNKAVILIENKYIYLGNHVFINQRMKRKYFILFIILKIK